MKKNRTILLLAGLWCVQVGLNAQFIQGADSSRYSFIQYAFNRIILPDSGTARFLALQDKLDNLKATGRGSLHFLQIGDSHIQADYLSSRVRDNLAASLNCQAAGRGFIFPYRFARTNNPENYHFSSNARWEADRSVVRTTSGDPGLAGVSVFTKDSVVRISLRLLEKNAPAIPFTDVSVLFESPTGTWKIEAEGMEALVPEIETGPLQRIHFHSDSPTDSLTLFFHRESGGETPLYIHGFLLSNGHGGIIYSAAGSNGASAESALRCNNLNTEITLVKPDVLILSLGTNDAYTRPFDRLKFRMQYDSLLGAILKNNPELPVILTTPGDAWAKNHAFNPCVPVVRDEIVQAAQKYQCAVWDLYTIMGGERSISKWYKEGLARKDRIHFSKEGYYLIGDLFTSALTDFYLTPLHPVCSN